MAVDLEARRERRHASRLPHRRYGFFRDDQMMFVLQHTKTLEADDQVRGYKELTSVINSELRQLYGGDGQNSSEEPTPDEKLPESDTPELAVLSVSPPLIARGTIPPQVSDSPQVISFSELTEEEREVVGELVKAEFLTKEEETRITSPFSIATYNMNNVPPDPAALITIAKALSPRLTQRLKENPIDGFVFQGNVLNWLTSVASQGAGTGGPGGHPHPYLGSRQNAPYRFSLKKQLKEKDIYGDGTGVDVVILDTAPSVQDLVRAYKELPDHPLVPTLLGPEGKLHLYPATYDDQLRMSCISLNDHDYKMTDHGLFIAGIIHSIVPKAEIHLIEVLNQYGVGDFWSFVQGLMTVFEKIYKPHRKMVVNCSWMLEFPHDELQAREKDDDEDPDATFMRIVQAFTAEKESLMRALEFLLSRLYGLGKQAVAAAGNDGKKEDPRAILARYPAALTRVAGVGALPRLPKKGGNNKYIPSVFSNLSDAPARNGIATFGGEEGEGKGVLGLYIGEFPCCCRNESKWAWWSGTSFATPLLTAAIASVLSNPNKTISWTRAAIEELYNASGSQAHPVRTVTTDTSIIQNNKVRDQEDAFLVVQS